MARVEGGGEGGLLGIRGVRGMTPKLWGRDRGGGRNGKRRVGKDWEIGGGREIENGGGKEKRRGRGGKVEQKCPDCGKRDTEP